MSTMIVDVGMVLAFGRALGGTGRLAVGTWRGEEWGNVGVNVPVGVVRGAFVVDVGRGRECRRFVHRLEDAGVRCLELIVIFKEAANTTATLSRRPL